jgi:hypothetical protein
MGFLQPRSQRAIWLNTGAGAPGSLQLKEGRKKLVIPGLLGNNKKEPSSELEGTERGRNVFSRPSDLSTPSMGFLQPRSHAQRCHLAEHRGGRPWVSSTEGGKEKTEKFRLLGSNGKNNSADPRPHQALKLRHRSTDHAIGDASCFPTL